MQKAESTRYADCPISQLLLERSANFALYIQSSVTSDLKEVATLRWFADLGKGSNRTPPRTPRVLILNGLILWRPLISLAVAGWGWRDSLDAWMDRRITDRLGRVTSRLPELKLVLTHSSSMLSFRVYFWKLYNQIKEWNKRAEERDLIAKHVDISRVRGCHRTCWNCSSRAPVCVISELAR